MPESVYLTKSKVKAGLLGILSTTPEKKYYLSELVTKDSDIRFAILYGSFARESEHGESDIDLLAVSDGKLEKFYAAISK